jgi:glucose/arabinose dehydrogenase
MAKAFRLLLILFGFVVCASTRTGLAQNQSTLSTETLVRGLDTPWAIDFAADGRMFITERPGRIRIIEHGQLQVEPWAQLEAVAAGEAGLMGLALDPQFSKNRFVYVAYTYRTTDGKPQNRLARLREDPKTGKGTLVDDRRRPDHEVCTESFVTERQDSSDQFRWLYPNG